MCLCAFCLKGVIPDMIYTVLGRTLNPTHHSLTQTFMLSHIQGNNTVLFVTVYKKKYFVSKSGLGSDQI